MTGSLGELLVRLSLLDSYILFPPREPIPFTVRAECVSGLPCLPSGSKALAKKQELGL